MGYWTFYTSNVTVSGVSDGQKVSAQDYDITVTPDNGYELVAGDRTTYKFYVRGQDLEGSVIYIDGTVNSDGTGTIAFNPNTVYGTSSPTLRLYITPKEGSTAKSWSITSNLANCTGNAPESVLDTDTLDITLTANTGYEFSTIPTLKYTDTDGISITSKFAVSSDKLTATKSFVPSDNACNSDIVITASATKQAQTWPIAIGTVAYATVTGIPESGTISENDTFNITIQANENYYFDSVNPPLLNFQETEGGTIGYPFTIDSADNTKATLTKSVADIISVSGTPTDTGFTINGSAIPVTVYVDKYGSIYVYNVTVDNLQAFAMERFITDTGTNTRVDLGDYVCKLFRIYCDIGDTQDTTLKVCTYDLSDITVKQPIEDTQIVDCGTVTLQGINNSAVDYNSDITIMLPFIGFEKIAVDTALNHALHLYYKINIVTGEAIAVLEIDNVASYFFDCKAMQEILYLTQTEKKYSDYTFTSKFLYGFTPYILYTTYTDNNKAIANNDSIRAQVDSLTGYFAMNELTAFNADNMNDTEKQEIIELLESGVYYGSN